MPLQSLAISRITVHVCTNIPLVMKETSETMLWVARKFRVIDSLLILQILQNKLIFLIRYRRWLW